MNVGMPWAGRKRREATSEIEMLWAHLREAFQKAVACRSNAGLVRQATARRFSVRVILPVYLQRPIPIA